MAGKKNKDRKASKPKKGFFRKLFGGKGDSDEVANSTEPINIDDKKSRKGFFSSFNSPKPQNPKKSTRKGSKKDSKKSASKVKSKAAKKSEFPQRKGKKPKFKKIPREKIPRKIGTKKTGNE
mmetsp:Transcript_15116/g.18691  ORF Transcript_15116/g.18691 Transcript_15116/m.18691 type:complete len:122 (+) Transcript_15116:861-1226(+)